MVNKYRGEAPFPEAGEGAFVCFTNTEMVALEAEYGDDFYEHIRLGLERASPAIIIKCLELGLKSGDERVRMSIGPDEYPFPLVEAQLPILDALTLSRTGMSYEEALIRAREIEDALDEAEKGDFVEEDPMRDLGSSNEPDSSDTERA